MATFEPVTVGDPLKPQQISPCETCGINGRCRVECLAFIAFADFYKTGKPYKAEDVQRFPPIKHVSSKRYHNPWTHDKRKRGNNE